MATLIAAVALAMVAAIVHAQPTDAELVPLVKAAGQPASAHFDTDRP